MKTLLLYLVPLFVSYTLGFYYSPYFFLIALVLGLNLIQSAFTGVDPIAYLGGARKPDAPRSVPPPEK